MISLIRRGFSYLIRGNVKRYDEGVLTQNISYTGSTLVKRNACKSYFGILVLDGCKLSDVSIHRHKCVYVFVVYGLCLGVCEDSYVKVAYLAGEIDVFNSGVVYSGEGYFGAAKVSAVDSEINDVLKGSERYGFKSARTYGEVSEVGTELKHSSGCIRIVLEYELVENGVVLEANPVVKETYWVDAKVPENKQVLHDVSEKFLKYYSINLENYDVAHHYVPHPHVIEIEEA